MTTNSKTTAQAQATATKEAAFGRAERASRDELYPPLKRWAKGRLGLASRGRNGNSKVNGNDNNNGNGNGNDNNNGCAEGRE